MEEKPYMPDHFHTQSLYAGRHVSLLARGGWEYASRNTRRPAVGIVALTDDDCVVLVEQYRPPVGRNVIELPAGLAGDIAGAEHELLVEAAKRELVEETGYVARHWAELGSGYSSPGLTDEAIAFFLAEGLEKRETGGGDGSEFIVIHEVPVARIVDWLAERDAMIDLKLMAGLFTALEHRKRRDNLP
jgi:ADP-ribose pyrophosphatase